MKIKSVLTTALLATTVLLTAGPSAQAALVYTAGDLFLGFRGTAAGDTQDYLVNIGNVSQFSNLDGGTVNVNLSGSIGPDLALAFGAGWANRSNVFWSISGTTYDGVGNTTPTIYATRARSQANTSVQSTPWNGASVFGQTAKVSKLQALALYYSSQGTNTHLVGVEPNQVVTPNSSTKGTFQSDTADNSYAFFTAETSDFNIGGSIEGAFNVTNGTANSVLDLYRIDPVAGSQGTYLGKFTISDTGEVTFSAVPEPSIYGLLIGAGLLTLVLKRRHTRRHQNA